MRPIECRDATLDDYTAVLALNRAEEHQTSLMNAGRLRQLAQLSGYYKVASASGQIAAFLIAMRENARYRNDNYNWFSSRYGEFVYVDRIVVGASCAGKGIGSAFYKDLFSYAQSNGIGVVACEYNIDPPNLASKRFHDKLGFREVGTQWVANRTKRVSLQVAEI